MEVYIVVGTILVTSNCQTGGIAAAFQALFPNRIVTAMEQPDGAEPAKVELLLRHLSSADIWVRNGNHQKVTGRPEFITALKGKKTIDIPATNFRAFHPDCIQARSRQSGTPVAPLASSQIVVWGYRNEVSPATIRRLFKADVYEELGYFAFWDPNVDRLRRNLGSSGLDFSSFFLRIKRAGSFMHTPGHPTIEYLTALSQVAAIKLGKDQTIMQTELLLLDALAQGVQWPVYPEIGDALGVSSSSLWKVANSVSGLPYLDLQSFIEFSYESYVKRGIGPADLEPNLPPSEIDQTEKVLSSWSRNL
jgi:hypothetical protein